MRDSEEGVILQENPSLTVGANGFISLRIARFHLSADSPDREGGDCLLEPEFQADVEAV